MQNVVQKHDCFPLEEFAKRLHVGTRAERADLTKKKKGANAACLRNLNSKLSNSLLKTF